LSSTFDDERFDDSVASQWDDLFFNLESSASASGEAAQRAFSKYVSSVNAITKSYDADVGPTPRELIWQLNKAKVYRYIPTRPADERHRVPFLLVYALINKPFIFDLVPGRSFVKYMLDEGFDIYLLDWGSPGPEDSTITFDDYVTQYLFRAVRKVRRVSKVNEISLLGYCIGATLTMTYAALYPEAPIRNIILLTAPIDFSNQPHGSMAVWLAEGRVDVDKLVDTYGNIPGELIRQWAKLLKPMENFVGVYVNLWKQLDDKTAVHTWQAINRWVEDVIPFAGEAFRQFVHTYLRGNKLIKGEHVIDGRPVKLSNVQASLLNIVAEYDHLVSQSQAAGIMDLISSDDKELRVIPATHVGIMISGQARYKLWPEVAKWLAQRSE
jgi:polyhydroxyalkanoate synthase